MAKKIRSDRLQAGVVWIELVIALPIIALIVLTVIDFSLKLSKTFQIQQMAEIVVSALRSTTDLAVLPLCDEMVQVYQDRIDHDLAPSIARLAGEIGVPGALRLRVAPPGSYSSVDPIGMISEGKTQEPFPPQVQFAVLKIQIESTEANCAVCWSQLFSNFRPSAEQGMYVSCQDDTSTSSGV